MKSSKLFLTVSLIGLCSIQSASALGLADALSFFAQWKRVHLPKKSPELNAAPKALSTEDLKTGAVSTIPPYSIQEAEQKKWNFNGPEETKRLKGVKAVFDFTSDVKKSIPFLVEKNSSGHVILKNGTVLRKITEIQALMNSLEKNVQIIKSTNHLGDPVMAEIPKYLNAQEWARKEQVSNAYQEYVEKDPSFLKTQEWYRSFHMRKLEEKDTVLFNINYCRSLLGLK